MKCIKGFAIACFLCMLSSASFAQNNVEPRTSRIAVDTSIGAMAPDFTQSDTAGLPVTLSSFKGKYVFLDFWASWCGPCRAENPTVIKCFNQYKDKGFTVISVSLDLPGKKDAWLKAIHEDKLPWTHISDLAGVKNTVAVLYGVKFVPANFLIDPQGKIIGKNLRGEALVSKLNEVFNK